MRCLDPQPSGFDFKHPTNGLVAVLQNVQAWADEEKAALHQRERQIAEAEARADSLLESAAADVDKQLRGLEEDRAALAKRQQQFEQVREGPPGAAWDALQLLSRCQVIRLQEDHAASALSTDGVGYQALPLSGALVDAHHC